MSAADRRAAVLRDAEHWAAVLRRSGYPEAQAAPEYCIGGEMGGGFFTYTVSVWHGPYKPETVPPVFVRAMAKAAARLAGKE